MNTVPTNQKPGLLTAIAVMTLTSGIVNLFWGFLASATALGTIIGIICVPITLLPTILGIFEIIYAARLLSAQPDPVQPSQTLAAFEILSLVFGNIFSMVVGILVLVFYNDLAVKRYFAEVNAPSAPTPPSAPASLPEPVPPEPVAPKPEPTPAKPKRGPRKVAKK